MNFELPEVFGDVAICLQSEKKAFLAHCLKLEKQKFLASILPEFKAQPHLDKVSFFTVNDGAALEVELTFTAGFNADEAENYWETQAITSGICAAYTPELDKFLEDRSLTRSMVLDEHCVPKHKNHADMLYAIENN